MTDSSTSQSNPSFLPEAESSVIPLGLHNPLLTPDALGQGKFSASLILLGSRRITVLDPSFFQRKPILQEGSELYDSDFFSVDTINFGNAPESLISSSDSSKIQRSSLPKIQSQESLSLISNLDQNSLLSKSSIDSSNLISDSTRLSNIDSSEFQSSLLTNNVQLKREEESTQLPYTAQRKSDLSTHSSNKVLDITSLDQNLSHSVEWADLKPDLKPDLKISDQPVQRFSIKEVSDSTQNTIQNTIRSESVIQSNKSDIEDSRISFPVSVEQVGLLPSSSTKNLQFQLEVEELVQTPITIEPTHQSTEQEIQRLSALEDSNSVQLQSNLSQPEQQSANSNRAIDREPIQIQHSNSTKSLTQDSSFDLLSTIDIQSKLESEEFNQSPNLIQKFQETVTSSQANLGEAITIEPTTHKTRQEIQRFSAIEDSISVQIQSDSSQLENKSLDSTVELDQQFTQIQRSTPSESTNQDLLIQLPSNIDTESKLESQELSQTSNLIQKNQEANTSSQTDSNIVIPVEAIHSASNQEIQRFSIIEDSSSAQAQIDLSQLEYPSVNSAMEIDREPTPIQRSTHTESLTQDLSIQSASNIDIPFKLESESESESFNQSSSLIQRYPEVVTSSQTNLEEAIAPANQLIEQQIQIVSVPEDSSIVQRQIDSFQPEQPSLGSSLEIDRQSIQIEPTPIQPSNSLESLTQDLSIQSALTLDIPFKLESKSFDQPSSLIQRYHDIPTSPQTNLEEAIAIESANQITDQQIQKFSEAQDSNSVQTQINASQPTYQTVNNAVEIDRESIIMQRSNSFESTNQDLSIQPLSNIDIQSKLESESFDQTSSLIQRYPDIPTSPQTNLEEAIEPANRTIEQQIQHLSVTEDSEDPSIVQRQIDSFQPEQQSLGSSVEIDRQSIQIEPTPIQPSNSPESLTQDLSIQSASSVDIQSKLESESFDQTSSLIQRYPEVVTSSQTNLEEPIEPTHSASNQEIQRFSIIEDLSPDPVQIDSSHLEHSSVNSPIESEREFTQTQRVTSSESTKKDLSLQSVSNVDIQSKLESESFDQTSSLIQRYHDIPTSSQMNLDEAIEIESANQTTDHQIQKLSEAQDSNSVETQVDPSRPTYQIVNDTVGIDRESITMQRSNSFESTNQDLSIQSPSNIDIQSKLESESFDQNSSLIQRYQEIPPSSQPNSSEAIEPTNQTIEQQIQRLSEAQDSNSSQVQIDPPQPEQQLVSLGIEIERQSITIQRSTSTEFIDKDLSIQSASSVDIQSKPESFDQPPSLIHKYQEAVISSQENLGEPIAIEPANQSPEQQIQRLVVTEDSEDPNVIQRQIDLSQPDEQPVNSVGGSDREPPQIQRLTIAPYLIQDSEQSITQLEDAGSPSIDTIGPEDKRPDQTIQRSSPIDSSNVDKIRINLSKSVDQEVNSWAKNDRHSIENQLLSSLPSEDKALHNQLSPSTDSQFKLEPDALNLRPNLIQKSQESPSSSTSSNISATEDILEISNDRIDIVSPKPEHHISDQLIQRSSAIGVPEQMSIGSSYLESQSVNLIDESSPSINKSLNSNIIKRTQESSSHKVQSIDLDFPIENSVSKSPNEPTSSINISIQDDITIDPDYIQRSSLSESQSEQPESSAILQQPEIEPTSSINISIQDDITIDPDYIQRSSLSELPSEQPESSAIPQQPEIEKLPKVFKDISILKPLIQPSLQRSILDISSTPRKLDPEPLNIWSTILQPRSQSHSPSSKTDSINSSSHNENSDNYYVINPSSPYNLNAKSDISGVMNSPQEWSSLESLVQMNSEPQKETLQRQSLESYPQIVSSQSTSNHNISNQSTISNQELSIQRNADPFSSSVESDQNYVEINSDRDPKFDREKIAESEQFEALAQEIYLLLRQRLVIDQERQGSGYSGRLPW